MKGECPTVAGVTGRWCPEPWAAVLSRLGETCPKMEPQENRAKDGYRLDSYHITCVPEMSAIPGLFSYVSQDISVLLKTV